MNPSTPYVKVLMLGSDLDNQGGIATMEKIYLDNWNYARFDVKHISSTKNGSGITKLGVALNAMTRFLYISITWRPDILHIHFSARSSFYRKSIFVAIAKLIDLKIVLHCHAPDFDSFIQNSNRILKKYILQIINLSDLLIVVSYSWESYFLSQNVAVPIRTIPNGIRAPDKTKIHLTSPLNPIILSLGRLGHRKGTYDTLKVIPMVLASCPRARFILAGDGDVNRVRSAVLENDWGKSVDVLDWVTGSKKMQLLKQTAIFLLPSYQEGLPVAILEAMAEGIPVVSTTAGGIPELVVDGITGYLVEPGDVNSISNKITSLLSDDALRWRMGMEAYRRVHEHFNADVMIERLYKSFEYLTSK